MGEPLVPLWTDENITNDARRATSNPTEQAKIRSCLLFMRHGYEAERTKDKQRIRELEAGYEARGKTIDAMAEDVEAMHAEIEQLRAELLSVLDVAIARGAELGYEDEDYHARYQQLTGKEWDNHE